MKNNVAYSDFSNAIQLVISNGPTQDSTTSNPLTQAPTKPTILNAVYDFDTQNFIIGWQISNSGSSPVFEVVLIFETLNSDGALTNRTIKSLFNHEIFFAQKKIIKIIL